MFQGKYVLSVIAFLCPVFVAAQDPSTGRTQQEPPGSERPERQDPMRSSSSSNTSANESDRILAAWVLSANNSEIVLARLAMQRATSNEVRQFAQKMVEEHGALASKLQPMVGSDMSGSQPGDRAGDRSGARPGEERSGERTGERSGERTGERSGERTGERTGERSGERSGERTGGIDTQGGRQGSDARARQGTKEFDHIALIRELDAKCLESSKKKLSDKSGAEFDACYMQMQVFTHTRAVDMLTVFGNHASPKLKATFESALKTATTHLEKAEQLVEQNVKTAQNPGTPGR